MPLPKSHITSLEHHLAIHEEEIASLHNTLETLAREIELREAGEGGDPNPKEYGIPGLIAERDLVEQQIEIHAALLALGRDQRVLDTLGEFIDNPNLAKEASDDPKLFAEARGIAIPTNMTLDLSVDDDGHVSLRVAYYDEQSPFIVTWDREGFSRPQLYEGQTRVDAEPD